jgi:phosphopentomutase
MDTKRVFLIVLDSFGIGEMPDAAAYGDEGSNTIAATVAAGAKLRELSRLGIANIEGVTCLPKVAAPEGAFARMTEASKGKDTTTGHWEMAGVISERPMPTYPDGFPQEVIDELSRRTGRGILCNKPYSGTDVIRDYGEEHLRTGDLIVYTSADSVLQIAAHEEKIPVEELYHICEIARDVMQGPHAVGRVIARPFIGEAGNFTRTPRRHDFSLTPPHDTMLDYIKKAGKDVIAVGKISDIFAGCGVTERITTTGNTDGLQKTTELLSRDFSGFCFVNLVDFDMLYGHRNDATGYARALEEFDRWLVDARAALRPGDVLMVTADHGCDPSTPSTDHSREYTPWLVCGEGIVPVDLKTRPTFADIGATILGLLDVSGDVPGENLAPVLKGETR